MASREDHLQQARANRALTEQLLSQLGASPTARQWAMTMVFYSAVHCIEAHCSALGVSHQSHTERADSMANPSFGVPWEVQLAYRRFRVWSNGGRYYLQAFSAQRVRSALDDQLAVITQFVKLDE